MARKSLAGSAAVMASGTLVSRVLGLVRAAMLAASIATVGGAADAFSVANKLPTIIYMLIAGGVLNAVLVPQIVRAMRAPDGGTRYVNQLLTLGSGVLAGVTALLTAGGSLLLTLYAASMSPEWRPLALTFAYICLPQLFFYGLYTLLGQVLNARGNFGPYMWAPVVNNIVSIAGLAVYLFLYGEYQWELVTPADWDALRIGLVAGTATAGIAAQALVLIIPLRRSGFRFTPVFQVRGSGLGRASKVAGWAFAALAVGQLGYVAISNLAVAAGRQGSQLGITVAGNATYDYAFTIFMLPQSLITVSLVTAMFTRMSHDAAAGDAVRVRDQLSMGLRNLAIFTVFATLALMVLAIPIVAVILAGGPSWEEQRAIGHVVVAFALGLVPIGMWTMVQRVYFAYEDTRSVFHIQIPMMLILVATCALAFLALPPTWWVAGGAALGTTISNSFGALVAYLALRRKLPSLDGARVLRTHLRVLLAGVPAAGIGWGLLHVWGVQAGVVGSLVRVAVIGTLMAVLYLVFLRLLDVGELPELLLRIAAMFAPITRRLGPRLGNLPGADGLRKIVSFFAPTRAKAGAVSEPWDAGDLVADRYHLRTRERDRSAGSYSLQVWQAEDTILARTVRLIEFQADEDAVAAALDAARRRALLTDEFFPKIYRVLDHAGRGIIITDPIEGASLRELITRGPLRADHARAILGETATALERARRQGVQHLALSPDSVLVTEAGVRVSGMGFEAALAGITAKSPDLGARQDAIGLAQLLFACLSGTWVGPAERSAGLPSAGQSVTSAQQLHELAPQAPVDLIRLCHVTMGPFEEGPHTPGEFAESLRPWGELPDPQPVLVMSEDFHTGEITAVPAIDQPSAPAGASPAPTGQPAGSGEPDRVADRAADLDETAATTARSTAAIVTGRGWDVPVGSPPAELDRGVPAEQGDTASGDPSPDAPGGASTFGPVRERVFPRVDPLPPPPESPPADNFRQSAQQEPSKLRGLAAGVAEQFRPVGADGTNRKFNPAGFVLLGMLALIVFAVVLALGSLRSASQFDPDSLPPPAPTVTPEEPTEEPSPSPTATAEPTETEEPEPESKPIVIDEAVTFDPSTEGGENQDLAHLAIDGDPSTFWRSLRYNSPTYAIKPGLGFSIILKDATEISEVMLNVHGSGGKVEIRAGDPQDPTAGDVLASGSMDGETTFTFEEPVETDTIVLWFPELPVADSDGMNRIELAEVSLK